MCYPRGVDSKLWMDKEGNPIDARRWAELHGDDSYMRIGEERMPGMWVSTVWLGINHNFAPQGPPILFETMIFGGPFDTECWRYSTEVEAMAGHIAIVSMLKYGRVLETAARQIEDGKRRHGMVQWARSLHRHYAGAKS